MSTIPDDVFRCYNCGDEGEISYPNGHGGQTPVCSRCELLLVRNDAGVLPMLVEAR